MCRGRGPETHLQLAPEQQDGAEAKEAKAMNIGNLKRDARGIFMGRIETFALSLNIGLRPVTSTNPAAPKFDVLARNSAGRFVQVGAL